MPKAIKKKSIQKKDEAGLDAQESLDSIKKALEGKQKSMATYGLAALGALILVGGVAGYRYNTQDRARQLEYDAYKTYYNMYQNTPEQDRAQKAFEKFQEAYNKGKSPRLLLFMADAQTEMNRNDDALKILGDFANRHADQTALLPIAYQKMAAIYLKKGNKDEALKILDKISNASGDLLKDFALLQKARILDQEGKKEEAAAKFRELTEKYPDSPYSEEAKARIGDKKAG